MAHVREKEKLSFILRMHNHMQKNYNHTETQKKLSQCMPIHNSTYLLNVSFCSSLYRTVMPKRKAHRPCTMDSFSSLSDAETWVISWRWQLKKISNVINIL